MTGTLTSSQLKALLSLASRRPRATSSSRPSLFHSTRKLEALGRRLGITTATLFERAAATDASIDELRAIKATAKKLLAAAGEPDDREAAGLLHNLAVAAAWGRHRVNLSSSPLPERLRLYSRLSKL